MTIKIKHQIGLGPIHDEALTIRTAVFVTEQGVSIKDEMADQLAEETALHMVAFLDNISAATARVREETPGIWHVQRVATLPSFRGQGIASQLFAYIESFAPQYHIHTLDLGAQVQAKLFYEHLQFEAYGSEFLDAGIVHISMKKHLD